MPGMTILARPSDPACALPAGLPGQPAPGDDQAPPEQPGPAGRLELTGGGSLAGDLEAEELVVEELSIDGMCGVY